MTDPYRVVIDVDHVALGTFSGIWPVTSWPRYWELQYSWNNGHQPWQDDPATVVQAWAQGRWHGNPVVRQVDASTFKVTGPGGQVDTVVGTRHADRPGRRDLVAESERGLPATSLTCAILPDARSRA